MSITVKDVAKKAGVATSTVSRVINDHPSISEDTKKKVRKVMQELGYSPNMTARNLGKQIASTIGVILPPLDTKERIGNPFFLETIEAVSEAASKYQMAVAVASGPDFDSVLATVQRMHKQKQADGFVLTYSEQQDPVIAYLLAENVPFTLIGQPYCEEDKITYVDNDNQLLGKQATEYLISKGHEKILFVTNTARENVYFERYFGYQKALMMAGLTVFPAATFTAAEDYVNFEDLLKNTGASAMVVIDDLFAVRVMQLANMYGYRIPEDLSVISFNNSIFATLTHPYLTSMDVDVARLGTVATEKLMEQIKTQQAEGVQIIVSHKLITRETVMVRR